MSLFKRSKSKPSVTCVHIPDPLPDVTPSGEGCRQCLEMGSGWVHLRMCVVCGEVGCCDDSPNRHARGHYQATPEHAIVRSYEPGEDWWYCFADELTFRVAGHGPLRPREE